MKHCARSHAPCLGALIALIALASATPGCSIEREGLFSLDAGVAPLDAPDSPPLDGGCVPRTVECTDGVLIECTATGTAELTPCPLGCAASAVMPGCVHTRASNLIDPARLLLAVGELRFAAGDRYIINTDDGSITTDSGRTVRPAGTGGSFPDVSFTVQTQAPSIPALAIFTVESLTIDLETTVTAVGARSLVVLSQGDVLIEGTLDVGAQGPRPGPGGGAGGNLMSANGGGTNGGTAGKRGGVLHDRQGGGGGGGHGARGGDGGDDSFLGATGPGGIGGAETFDQLAVPLVGGGGGGRNASGTGGSGGGGGGGLQLTSDTRIRVGGSGIIRAPGEGGGAGATAGGGGGAGGTILLEAPEIDLSAGSAVAANGGGGGGGDSSIVGDAMNGQRGGDTADSARGGAPVGSGAGAGSEGGAGFVPSGEAGKDGGGGGGGGGASGRLRFLSAAGMLRMDGVVSPAAPPVMTTGAVLTF